MSQESTPQPYALALSSPDRQAMQQSLMIDNQLLHPAESPAIVSQGMEYLCLVYVCSMHDAFLPQVLPRTHHHRIVVAAIMLDWGLTQNAADGWYQVWLMTAPTPFPTYCCRHAS